MTILSAAIIRHSSGLNTLVDPARIDYDPAKGIADLSQAYNISIDETGLISSRIGDVLAQSGQFHSLYCDSGDAFIIQERQSDAALMKIGTDLSLAGIRSGLTKNARMSFAQVNYDTFYSNGHQNGYVREGNSFSWPTGSYQGPDTNYQFSPAPVGNHIAFKAGGLMLIAEGSTLWINHEPFAFGLFNMRSGFVQFATDIKMVCPVATGVFVSDSEYTWFLKGTSWYDFVQSKVSDYPAIEWSLNHTQVQLSDLDIKSPGFGRVWASLRGVCLGADDGSMINLTEDKVKYPSGYDSGACLVTDTHIIHTVES